MSAVVIRPFEPMDAYLIELRNIDKADYAGIDYFWLVYGYWNASQVKWTIEADGKIVACGGVRMCGAEGTAWILSSELVNTHRKVFHKTVKRLIDDMFAVYGARRIATLVLPQNKISRRWLKRLGMRPEGLARKCGPNGLDRLMYARVAK
jgi:RimJ/RimL family protein N-acetyltransferase